MSTISPFKDIKIKSDVYRGEDWIKEFIECLKNHTRRITNFKKKKMKLLTHEK